MSDDHAAAQRRLLRLAAERAVVRTKTLPPTVGQHLRLKIQGVVAQAWLEGYAHAVDDLKAHMKETELERQNEKS